MCDPIHGITALAYELKLRLFLQNHHTPYAPSNVVAFSCGSLPLDLIASAYGPGRQSVPSWTM